MSDRPLPAAPLDEHAPGCLVSAEHVIVDCSCGLVRRQRQAAAAPSGPADPPEGVGRLGFFGATPIPADEFDESMRQRPCPACAEKDRALQEMDRAYAQALTRVEQSEAQVVALREALETAIAVSSVAYAEWDADHDSKVGKLLKALAGCSRGYRADIDEMHAALRPPTPTETP